MSGPSPHASSPASDVPGVMQVALSLDPGGTERLIVELAKRTSDSRRVAVCCLDGPGLWAAELSDAGIEVFALERKPGFHPQLAHAIASAARARRITVLHCHQYSSLIYGGLARLFNPGLRLVFTEHGRLSDAPPSLKRRLVTPPMAWFADELYAVSDDLRRYLLTAGFPARLRVITNGIVPGPKPTADDAGKARRQLGAQQDEIVIAAVGRLNEVKDLPTLFRALPLLASKRAVLYVLGDGPDRAALAELAVQLGLRSVVRFMGHREDVRSVLSGADIFVNTSISEGISLTLLEAMAACLPIVATAVGGTPEVVVDHETGRLVPARDPLAVAASLDELIANPMLRRRFGSAGRARVESAFTLDRMVGQYLAVYDRLIRGGRSSGDCAS
jgi:L-malate glycosyltransferase